MAILALPAARSVFGVGRAGGPSVFCAIGIVDVGLAASCHEMAYGENFWDSTADLVSREAHPWRRLHCYSTGLIDRLKAACSSVTTAPL